MDLFFELLQMALGQRDTLSRAYSANDWQEAFDISTRQAVEGITLIGAERLPAHQQPPKELMMQWTFNCGFFASKSARLDKASRKVVENFARRGWKSCILKGQGLATLYPVPYRRHAGDIDVWVDAPAQDIIQYVHQLCPDSHVVYHHIDFPIWDDISIELHFFPSFLYAPDNDRRLQEFFERNKERIMQHQVTLADGKSVVTCPDSEFNAVYLLCHMFNHLMEELIVMRQYLDYYYVLRDIKDDETRRRVAEDVRRIGLNTLAGGVMYVMGEFFGLEKEYMFVEPDEKIGRFLQKEIMRGDAIEELEHRNSQGSFSHFVDRTRRSFATMRYFPKESAWSPLTRARHWICRWKRSK